MDILRVAPTSRASSNQRAGRAGRTSSGKCFRLYPEGSFASLPSSTPPELCRSDVSLVILQLKSLGIDNVMKFDFMTPPPSGMFERGLEFLFSLGALDRDGRLTHELGIKMAEVGFKGVPSVGIRCHRFVQLMPLVLGRSSLSIRPLRR